MEGDGDTGDVGDVADMFRCVFNCVNVCLLCKYTRGSTCVYICKHQWQQM